MAKEWRGQTQWTAQFLAASELVRLGYVVSFTMGNHTPVADLMVGSQESGNQFWVDVKGDRTRRGWYARPKKELSDLYYILVHVAKVREKDQFFILSQAELDKIVQQDREAHQRKPGFEQVKWPDATPYLNCWNRLPRAHPAIPE